MNDLTVKQRRILKRIHTHWRNYGEGPTTVELAEHYDVWPNTINGQVEVLRNKGYLEPSKGKAIRSPLVPVGYRERIREALK